MSERVDLGEATIEKVGWNFVEIVQRGPTEMRWMLRVEAIGLLAVRGQHLEIKLFGSGQVQLRCGAEARRAYEYFRELMSPERERDDD